jgi:hypothetical protein
MSLAANAREKAREHPFIYGALEAGVLNYSAAARFLDIGDEESVAAALRRYGEELEYEPEEGTVRVRMETGLGRRSGEDGLLSVDGTGFVPGEGSLTAVLATGEISVRRFRGALARCETEGVDPHAAGVTDEAFLIVVDRRDGPDALRIVESVCEP